MVFHKKWKDRVLGVFNTERAKLKILKELGIETTYACNLGIDNCIKSRVEAGQAPAHVVAAWIELYKQEYEDLKRHLKILEGDCSVVREVKTEMDAEEKRLNKKVLVYDTELKIRCEITVKIFESDPWRYSICECPSPDTKGMPK